MRTIERLQSFFCWFTRFRFVIDRPDATWFDHLIMILYILPDLMIMTSCLIGFSAISIIFLGHISWWFNHIKYAVKVIEIMMILPFVVPVWFCEFKHDLYKHWNKVQTNTCEKLEQIVCYLNLLLVCQTQQIVRRQCRLLKALIN